MAIGRSSKRKVLGVAPGERGALLAEAVWNGQGPRVTRVAEFRYPAGLTPESGAALGGALAAFLRERGFSARQAVVGLPAKWLISRSHVIPPADEPTAAMMLRLRGEAESAAELGEMVFDFAGQARETTSSNVLLIALPRRRLDAVLAAATAAGLSVQAVTACATALAAMPSGLRQASMMLSIRADGAELATVDGGQVRSLRHLGSAVAGPGLVAELRRAAAVVPVNGAGREMVVWDDVGLDPGVLDTIRAAVGMPIERGDATALGVVTDPNMPASGASAIALALAGGRRTAVDFLHPRITAPAKPSVSRRVVWGATAAAVAVLVGAVAYADLAKLERQVADTSEHLKQLDPAYRLAKPFVDDMRFAESFREGQPRYLACLRDVTQAMPAEGQAYLTGFVLRANMQGELMGRAASNQDVLNLLEKLNAGGRFAGLRRKLDARGKGNEVSFYLTFTYVPRS